MQMMPLLDHAIALANQLTDKERKMFVAPSVPRRCVPRSRHVMRLYLQDMLYLVATNALFAGASAVAKMDEPLA
jgi:hypothetical protein